MSEIQEVFEHIDNGHNFLLSGGAGSGKTYALVQVIKEVIEKNPSALIACMTYTNAAVKEIEERVNHQNLNVTTIHDFLWDNIKHFQKELKKCLVELANEEDVKVVKVDSEEPVREDFFDDLQDPDNPKNKIQYKEFLRISKGIISHDQIIAVGDRMFEKYPRLGDIVKDKYKFIFIDEYQDTQKEVVKIFLNHFKLTNKRNVVGFFGDAMQSIYPNTIGNLDEYKGTEGEQVREVKKEQNRRNPSSIIELANKLRTDGLTQSHSDDRKAPNMVNGNIRSGGIKFLYSEDGNIDAVKEFLDWDFEDSMETKELNLTHNLIADRARIRTLVDIYDKDQILKFKNKIKTFIKENHPDWSFENMSFREVMNRLKEVHGESREISPSRGRMTDFIESNPELYNSALDSNYDNLSNIYIDKDQLLDDKKQDDNNKGSKRDELIRHLYRLQNIIWLYENGLFNEFLRVTDYITELDRTEKKRILKERIESLVNVGEKTIGEIIEEAHRNGVCKKGDGLIRFELEKKYVYDQVIEVPYTEFQALYEYLEGRTPFSTQHKTKGIEFNNVLVILDNGNWNDYNFEYLFDESNQRQLLVEGGSRTRNRLNSFPKILQRTQKIFYVCCTRAKEQLAVYYHAPSERIISKARDWFGEGNVVNLNA